MLLCQFKCHLLAVQSFEDIKSFRVVILLFLKLLVVYKAHTVNLKNNVVQNMAPLSVFMWPGIQ